MDKVKNRELLIEKIKGISDQNLIDEINRLLDIGIDESAYILSKDQKEAIQEARNQINNGEGIPSDQIFKEADEWTKK